MLAGRWIKTEVDSQEPFDRPRRCVSEDGL